MSKQTEAMKLALKALEWNMCYLPSYGIDTAMAINAMTALREALAEQPAQPSKPLTDGEIVTVAKSIDIEFKDEGYEQQLDDILTFARAIESRLWEKDA